VLAEFVRVLTGLHDGHQDAYALERVDAETDESPYFRGVLQVQQGVVLRKARVSHVVDGEHHNAGSGQKNHQVSEREG
jgi:hypothetical protein